MKQKLVSIVTSVLTVLTVTTAPFSAVATEKPMDYTIKDYTTAESFYNRVILSKAFQTSEDRAANGEMLQLPQYMLDRMTTDALVEAVLDYPYFFDVYAFDNVQTGVDLMMEHFNGVQELADRDDVASVLLDKYCDEEVLTDASADDDVFRLTNMEILLAQDFVTTKLSKKDKCKFVKNVASKLEDKAASSVYSEYTCNLLFDLTEKNAEDGGLLKDLQSVRDAYAPGGIYTPNGTLVYAYTDLPELSADEIKNINKRVKRDYPNVTKLGEPTQKYNCHSYAWYWQSTSNYKWINDPSAYWNDGSYTQTSSIQAGYKVVYHNTDRNDPYLNYWDATHSAIVYSKSGSTVTVTSKWGNWGLYRHNTGYSPYYNYALRYYKR